MEKVVMVTLMLTRNDYVPNPSSSHKYEVNVSVDDDDDDDDDYDMTKLQLLPRQLRSQDERK